MGAEIGHGGDEGRVCGRVCGPGPAERARTLAYGMADGALAVPGVPYQPVPAYTTDRDGRPLLLVERASPIVAALAGKADLVGTLRISDVAPVAMADRMRGRAWIHGWLTELPLGELRAAAIRLSRPHPRPELLDLADGNGRREWTVLALEVAEAEIEDAWGGAILEPEEYAAGAPDPFVAVEAGMLTHLDSCHRDELARLLPPAAVAENTPEPVVHPLALDRYGLWLRRCAPPPAAPDPVDVRLTFAQPVSDLHGLRCVYRRLFAAATP
ncbi:DUF2470 domain-containing protein [Actinomadura sp. NEAU-AAG7]|uniref:DUF2470 domain-containing protein n=1 Tax=Actinomadura sp. NEAU-AAG7 TaxID=2839640 RepID=UPI00203274B1|nr:DUF2470 domain-containing protein [Actinomadura sp. NEAU-AAG7]